MSVRCFNAVKNVYKALGMDGGKASQASESPHLFDFDR